MGGYSPERPGSVMSETGGHSSSHRFSDKTQPKQRDGTQQRRSPQQRLLVHIPSLIREEIQVSPRKTVCGDISLIRKGEDRNRRTISFSPLLQIACLGNTVSPHALPQQESSWTP